MESDDLQLPLKKSLFLFLIFFSPEEKARMSSQQRPSTQHGTNRHKTIGGAGSDRKEKNLSKLNKSISLEPLDQCAPEKEKKRRRGRKKERKIY
jgi:hypothetical protein